MKTITLMSALALSSFVATGTEATPAPAQADNSATTTPACTDNMSPACCDECDIDIETITLLAENGDPIAQYTIAWITDNGTPSTPAAPEKAQEMYAKALPGLEKAAKDGDPKACNALAHMYTEGKGVAKDPEKARAIMKWCKGCCDKKAADKSSQEGTAAPEQQPAEM